MIYGITDLKTFVLGTIIIVLLPGPNSLYVLSVAARRGVRLAYQGACGVFLGDAILMLLSATGVAALLKATPALFLLVKYAGAAYLVWMGVGLMRGAWQRWRGDISLAQQDAPAVQPANDARPFRAALTISLLNPKAILFFVSFFIQFVDPAYPYPAVSFLMLGLICETASLVYLTTLIFAGVRLAELFRRRRRLSAAATGGVGVLFIGFGAKLANATLS